LTRNTNELDPARESFDDDALMLRRRRIYVLALLALLSGAPAAFADDGDVNARAQALKAEADALVLEGRLEEAVFIYSQSLALADTPLARYNRGRTFATLGRHANALDDLERFDRAAAPDVRARVPGLTDFLAQLRTRVSRLRIECDVAGARIVVRGVELGTTPTPRELTLDAGNATVQIVKDGYFDYRRELTLPGGAGSTLQAHLVPKATMAVVHVTSPIVGANVTIDGRYIGVVPVESMLTPGRHSIVVAHEGYASRTRVVTSEAGVALSEAVSLDREESLATKWWFWTAVGVGVLGGTAAVIALTTERDGDRGSLPPGAFTVGFTSTR